MSRIAFLLAKDPATARGGDIAMQQLQIDIARAEHDVVRVVMSPDVDQVERSDGLVRVPKEPVSALRVARRSARRGRSLLHARYDSETFARALDEVGAEVFVAEHSYLAETFLRSRHARGPARLLVVTDVQESQVWRETRGLLGRIEAPRIRRDELRVGRAAHGLATYDREEAEDYRRHGVDNAVWLDLTLPPTAPIDVRATGPRLLFFGEQGWPPNARAADELIGLWDRISAPFPDAELVIAGNRPPGVGDRSTGSIRDVGFVDDLVALMSTCRALAAPIRTGAGVRVKILDAASRGLPVVSTPEGLGTLGPAFGLDGYADPAGFVSRCQDLLRSAEDAGAEGARLHEANAARWSAGLPQRQLLDWLSS